MAKSNLTESEFDVISNQLARALDRKLKAEIEPDEFSLDYTSNPNAGGDLFELPEVPSKAVVKLSGTVKKFLGVGLPCKFIQSGGYDSRREAIGHLIHQLRTLCKSEVKAA